MGSVVGHLRRRWPFDDDAGRRVLSMWSDLGLDFFQRPRSLAAKPALALRPVLDNTILIKHGPVEPGTVQHRPAPLDVDLRHVLARALP